MLITLMGYTQWHTHWYSWNRFCHVFKTLGFDVEWTSSPQPSSQQRLWICWRKPSAEDLYASGIVKQDDIVFQKLHPFSDETTTSYESDALSFLKAWHWPVYLSLERMVEEGKRVYGFGCATRVSGFPEKERIVQKLQGRIFWIPYGSVHFSLEEIQSSSPVMDSFEYDTGFVGSRWGRPGMGNLDSMEAYLDPLATRTSSAISGLIGSNYVSELELKSILKHSRLCPIVHAPFWKAEQGIQDRFWTVFTAGRFGVTDNEGIYRFFGEDEVVVGLSPDEYLEKSLYYLKHVDKQLPFVLSAQRRIKSEYNLYFTWGNILKLLKLTD